MRILVLRRRSGDRRGSCRNRPRRSPIGPRPTPSSSRTFRQLVRFDTTDPPGGERPAVEYLKKVLGEAGIESQEFALEPNRPNLVARLKGNGKKRPLLLMGHTDTVNVDASKWTSSAVQRRSRGRSHLRPRHRGRQGQRRGVADGDAAAQAAERAARPRRDLPGRGRRGRLDAHRHPVHGRISTSARSTRSTAWPKAATAIATGGNVRFMSVQTLEKIPYAIELVARGPAGHGSVPLEGNAVAHVSAAVAAVAKWTPPVRLNETTSAYFKRLAEISPAAEAQRYRDVLDPKKIEAGGRVLPQERAPARVDAAHVRLAQHHSGRLSHQRDSVGSHRDASMSAPCRTRTCRRSSR